jgi:predicted CopG family antitoxin
MAKATEHIIVDEEVKEFLKKEKLHPRESFNEVLRRLLKLKGKKE